MHHFARILVAILASHWLALSAIAQENASEAKQNHFESKIRPALITYCQECHSASTERSGGLLLDSAEGWQKGGDSGAAIQAGKPEDSLLLRAISYSNPKLQMPPDGKLPDEVIEDFRVWIESGAFDPRKDPSAAKPNGKTALSVEDAQQHWAYQPIVGIDQLSEAPRGISDTIDGIIDTELVDQGIAEWAPSAEEKALVRRLYFDLTGLPPTGSELEKWSKDLNKARYAELVDQLLASPRFGENIARRWMDVVRYADSVTLRGFVHRNAWRYRDYLIDSFNQDRSFQQMIREQVAGDLLPAEDEQARTRQLIATAFLALGNTNLEKQDKAQLDMDYIDEQLEVIGAAFLGQTIGCARCHDHKFDPIPTRDYYALAGILKSAVALKHDNVSTWIELPLPLADPAQKDEFEQLESQRERLTKSVQMLKKKLEPRPKNSRFIEPAELPGIVVDSSQATLVGSWTQSSFVGDIVGKTYIHDGNEGKGQKSATFEPEILPPGEYQVLLAYQASDNRATNVVVKVFSADGDAEVVINQRATAPELGLWFNLGRYRFEANGQKYVLVSNAETNGHVILDAVLFLPVTQLKDSSLAATLQPASNGKENNAETELMQKELKELEGQVATVNKTLQARPMYLSVNESGKQQDIPIHIRGDVHSLGEVVPRGFLTAIKLPFEHESPDRLQLANWLSHDQNPLTARVYANRVWSWMMGSGIVPTPNNFGTTGAAPTNIDLLNELAIDLIQSGWSTKSLIRQIVNTKAYRRAVVEPTEIQQLLDPDNRFYWRANVRRLPVEALRDTMLSISGELDETRGGSIIKSGAKDDYNYTHTTTRRSIYHPVFRNSLPELFDQFDFPNSSNSAESRARSTVAPQGLALMQDPWVTARCKQAAIHYASLIRTEGAASGIERLYLSCFSRLPHKNEMQICVDFLDLSGDVQGRKTAGGEGQGGELVAKGNQSAESVKIDVSKLEQLIQALFSSVDFRYLD
jgi:Protein of unknown function (DUF1553)/Protein of unknown function (DUF1549)/Planctomycete cytochrome C